MALPKLTVKVGADTREFVEGMKDVQKGVDSTSAKMARAAGAITKYGVRLAAAATAAGGAFIAASRNAASAAREIENLARLAGVGTTEFQRLAAAGQKVGFGQEKMADIFKDVNDKFGDFMATGAGPLADFFENIAPMVGVTADQFARLSGPDALQLYVDSLEKAGVSQQQMTFYMEALANDATALLPLLKDNGKAMKQFGDEAQHAGRIMDRETLQAGVRLDRKFTELGDTIRQKVNKALLEHSDELTDLVDASGPVIDALVAIGVEFGSLVTKIAPLIQAVADFVGKLNQIPAWAQKMFGVTITDPETGEVISQDDQSRVMGTDFRNSIAGRLLRSPDAYSHEGENFVFPPKKTTTTGGGVPVVNDTTAGGGGGGRGLTDDLADLRESLMTQAEEIDAWREEQLEKLREFRDAKLITEQEYNELEAEIAKKHQGAISEINRSAMQDRLAQASEVFSGLSSLMQTENKKLFEVGKAAAVAQAVVDGISAGVSAWEKGMAAGGPPMAAAFAAASLARTGAEIAALKSASPNGTGGGGGGGVGAPAASAQAAPLDVRLSGMSADQFISGASLESLFDRLQDEAGDRGLRVSFAT